MSEITNDRLREIEERVASTYRGPWEITPDCHDGPDEVFCRWHRVGPIELTGSEPTAVSRFIAAARDDVPALVAEVRRLREVVERLRADATPGDAEERIANAILAWRRKDPRFTLNQTPSQNDIALAEKLAAVALAALRGGAS